MTKTMKTMNKMMITRTTRMARMARIRDPRGWRLIAATCLIAACSASSDPPAPGLPPAPSPSELSAPSPAPAICDYPQAFGTPDHAGLPCPELHGMRVVARIPQDDDADAENEESGFLQVHESPPLTSGDFVVIGHKSGFTSIFDRSTEHYDVRAYRWLPSVDAPGASLLPIWEAATDWQPVDGKVASQGFLPPPPQNSEDSYDYRNAARRDSQRARTEPERRRTSPMATTDLRPTTTGSGTASSRS